MRKVDIERNGEECWPADELLFVRLRPNLPGVHLERSLHWTWCGRYFSSVSRGIVADDETPNCIRCLRANAAAQERLMRYRTR